MRKIGRIIVIILTIRILLIVLIIQVMLIIPILLLTTKVTIRQCDFPVGVRCANLNNCDVRLGVPLHQPEHVIFCSVCLCTNLKRVP